MCVGSNAEDLASIVVGTVCIVFYAIDGFTLDVSVKEPALPADTVGQLKMRLANESITRKDLLSAFDKVCIYRTLVLFLGLIYFLSTVV